MPVQNKEHDGTLEANNLLVVDSGTEFVDKGGVKTFLGKHGDISTMLLRPIQEEVLVTR